MLQSNEPMVAIQGKVPSTIKNRIRLLIEKRQISESEFIRELAEGFFNGTSNEDNNSNSNKLEEKLDALMSEMQQMRVNYSATLDYILRNVTDDPDAVDSLLATLRARNFIY